MLDRAGRTMSLHALDRLGIARGDRVLEVGFGGGFLLGRLLESEAQEVVGMDLSDAMVGRARRRCRRELEAGRLRLLTGSAEALPRREGGFDKVCSVNTIYFWSRPAAVLSELARVTRQGGKLALAFQLPESVRSWPGHVHGFHAYGAEEVARLMEDAGFQAPEITSGNDPKVGDFACLTSERK